MNKPNGLLKFSLTAFRILGAVSVVLAGLNTLSIFIGPAKLTSGGAEIPRWLNIFGVITYAISALVFFTLAKIIQAIFYILENKTNQNL